MQAGTWCVLCQFDIQIDRVLLLFKQFPVHVFAHTVFTVEKTACVFDFAYFFIDETDHVSQDLTQIDTSGSSMRISF